MIHIKFRIMVTFGVKGGTWNGGHYRRVYKLLSVMFYFLSWVVATKVFIKLLIVLF